VHFIGPTKPWHYEYDTVTCELKATGAVSPHLLQLWWDIFLTFVNPRLTKYMPGLVGQLALLQVQHSSPRFNSTPHHAARSQTKTRNRSNTVKTSTAPPSWILSTVIFHAKIITLFLSDCKIWWRYLKPRPSYNKWKIFSMAVLTLSFDLDLWKVNSEMLRRCWTSASNFTKSNFYFSSNFNERHEQTNELTNEPTNTPDHNNS